MGLHILNNKNEPKLRLSWGFKFYVSPQNLVSKLVILLHFVAEGIYQEAHALSNQDNALCRKFGRNWYTFNLTLFTHHHILYALYAKPSMKLAGRVSSVAVIFLWQVTETVVEAIFLFFCLWIKCSGGHLDFFWWYLCLLWLIYSPLCWNSSISPTYIWAVILFINPFPCNFL